VIDLALVETVLADAWRRDSPAHGEAHWRCVAATGLALVPESSGADPAVVFLFGLLHDTRRENEHYDPGHGLRAAAHTRQLAAARVLPLETPRLDLLCHALELHSDGLVSEDATVAVCWDADRLHLPRVGIDPDPERFSTALARRPEQLAAAARLRETAPTWVEVLALVRP
jgi:uncharacterized protein